MKIIFICVYLLGFLTLNAMTNEEVCSKEVEEKVLNISIIDNN